MKANHNAANMVSFFWLNPQSIFVYPIFIADVIASFILFGAGFELRYQQVRYNWFGWAKSKAFYCYGVDKNNQPSCTTQCDYCKHAQKGHEKQN